MTNTNAKTKKLVETGLLFAMALILSMIKLYRMPWGGAVTLVSMLPIVLISYRYGLKWGFFASSVYTLLQIILDIGDLRGISAMTLVGSLLFDYVLGYTALGLGGLFRNKMKNPSMALACGSAVAIFGRFVGSFLSGFLLWGSYAEDTLKSFGDGIASMILDNFSGWGLSAIYSLVYNAAYLLPELILTFVVALIIGKVKVIQERY